MKCHFQTNLNDDVSLNNSSSCFNNLEMFTNIWALKCHANIAAPKDEIEHHSFMNGLVKDYEVFI